MIKICSCCGQSKPAANFTKRKASKDGLTSSCSVCLRIRDKKRGYHGKGSLTIRAKYPNQYKAQNTVNNAIRDGRLGKKVCEVCGSLACSAWWGKE